MKQTKRSSLASLFILFALLIISLGCDPVQKIIFPPTPTPTMSLTPSPSPTSAPASCNPNDTIVIGYTTQSSRFATEGPAGFDIDLMNRIAANAGFEKEYVPWDSTTILNALERGEIAVAVGAIPIIPAHENQADFSDPYFERGLVIVTRKDSIIQTATDLKNRYVGVQPGTRAQRWCENDTDALTFSFSSIEEAFDALNQGDQIDALISEKLRAVGIINQSPNRLADLRLLGEIVTEKEQYGYRQYGIAVRKGCSDLLKAINDGLAHAKEVSDYQGYCKRHFGMVEACMRSGSPTPTPLPTASSTPTPPLTTPTPPSAVISPDFHPEVFEPCREDESAEDSAGGYTYTIQKGDTLSGIARREYGRDVDYKAIFERNTNVIADPSLISPGWQIYLPTRGEVADYWDEKFSPLPKIDWTHWRPLTASGSSTVFPLTTRLAGCFVDRANDNSVPITVTIESAGTFGGLERFCAGQADILDASVGIGARDLDKYGCDATELIEMQMGTDAVSIVVSKESSFISDKTSITLYELREILSTAEYWSDVRSEWPDEKIQRFYPTEESGTLEFVSELLFDENMEALLSAAHVTSSEDDVALARQIANDPYAVGFFGYAYYQDSADTLQALPVEGKRPLPEGPDSKDPYPLERPLFIYTTPDTLKDRPGVAAFINFYLREVNDHVVDVGYFPPSEEAYQRSVEAFLEAMQ